MPFFKHLQLTTDYGSTGPHDARRFGPIVRLTTTVKDPTLYIFGTAMKRGGDPNDLAIWVAAWRNQDPATTQNLGVGGAGAAKGGAPSGTRCPIHAQPYVVKGPAGTELDLHLQMAWGTVQDRFDTMTYFCEGAKEATPKPNDGLFLPI